jgi:predicted transcriptional regulator
MPFSLMRGWSSQGRTADFMDVLTVLKQSSRPVCTITDDHSVDDAIKLMTAQKAGALIVTTDDDPTGIFTEKDVLRCYQQAGNLAPSEIKLNSVITRAFIAAKPTDNLGAVINLMIKSDIDQLPVIENKKIIGVLALKDLAEFQIDSLHAEIDQLQGYIDDLHQAAQD